MDRIKFMINFVKIFFLIVTMFFFATGIYFVKKLEFWASNNSYQFEALKFSQFAILSFLLAIITVAILPNVLRRLSK